MKSITLGLYHCRAGYRVVNFESFMCKIFIGDGDSVNQETSEKSAEISISWLPEKTTTM